MHNQRFASTERTVNGLKRKFSSLYNTTPPTGDSNISPDILRAKKLNHDIIEKADAGDHVVGDLAIEENNEDNSPSAHLNTQIPLNESISSPTPQLRPRPLVMKRSSRKRAEGNENIGQLLSLSLVQEEERLKAEREEHKQKMELDLTRFEQERKERFEMWKREQDERRTRFEEQISRDEKRHAEILAAEKRREEKEERERADRREREERRHAEFMQAMLMFLGNKKNDSS